MAFVNDRKAKARLALALCRQRNERELTPLFAEVEAAKSLVAVATAAKRPAALECLGHREARLRSEQQAADGRLACALDYAIANDVPVE